MHITLKMARRFRVELLLVIRWVIYLLPPPPGPFHLPALERILNAPTSIEYEGPGISRLDSLRQTKISYQKLATSIHPAHFPSPFLHFISPPFPVPPPRKIKGKAHLKNVPIANTSPHAMHPRTKPPQLHLLPLLNLPRIAIAPLHRHLTIRIRIDKNIKRTWPIQLWQKSHRGGDLSEYRLDFFLDFRFGFFLLLLLLLLWEGWWGGVFVGLGGSGGGGGRWGRGGRRWWWREEFFAGGGGWFVEDLDLFWYVNFSFDINFSFVGGFSLFFFIHIIPCIYKPVL